MNKYHNIHANIATVFASIILLVPFLASAYIAAPVANTKNPTFITEKSAVMNGSVNSNETPDTYAWFEWGISGRNTVYETSHRQVGAGAILTDFKETAYGLAPNVQYFYRQIAESSRGRDVGVTTYFTTKGLVVPVDPAVIVQTNTPTNILEKSAMLRGYIAPHEGQGVRWWFEWGTSNRLENKTSANTWGRDSGVAQSNILNLTSGTQYFYRIVAENSQGVVYGGIQTFVTLGTPPPPPEIARSQSIPQAGSGDGVSRAVTSSQSNSNSGSNNNAGSGQASNGIMSFNWGGTSVNTGNNLPGSSQTVPGNIFSSLFGGNKNTSTGNSGVVGTTATGNNTASQNVGATANTPIGSFWNVLTGKKVAQVTVEKIGPRDTPAHTPVEYRVTYAYRQSDVATNAKLKVILPGSVVYIGDNTTNELLLEDGAGPERTYVLPVGRLENGSTRTISILGMTTSDANGTFPDARARLEFTSATAGVQIVSAEGVAVAEVTSASASDSRFSIFPSSIVGWVLYIVMITLLIFLVRKGRAYYEVRKAAILAEAEMAKQEKNNQQMRSGVVVA